MALMGRKWCRESAWELVCRGVGRGRTHLRGWPFSPALKPSGKGLPDPRNRSWFAWNTGPFGYLAPAYLSDLISYAMYVLLSQAYWALSGVFSEKPLPHCCQLQFLAQTRKYISLRCLLWTSQGRFWGKNTSSVISVSVRDFKDLVVGIFLICLVEVFRGSLMGL